MLISRDQIQLLPTDSRLLVRLFSVLLVRGSIPLAVFPNNPHSFCAVLVYLTTRCYVQTFSFV